jgi:hypothetical protein
VVESVRAVNVPFLVFVLALGIVVQAVMRNGLADQMGAVLPSGSGLTALLGIAVVAAVLANILNNLPATLVLLPLVATSGPAAILAVLIGVNIGPNLTYVGSLSNLLASRATPLRRVGQHWRIHQARAVHRPPGARGGGAGAVGQCAAAGGLAVVGRWQRHTEFTHHLAQHCGIVGDNAVDPIGD